MLGCIIATVADAWLQLGLCSCAAFVPLLQLQLPAQLLACNEVLGTQCSAGAAML